MPESRHIELEILDDTDCRIIEQTHRRDEFTPEGMIFHGTEINIQSCNCPAVDYYEGDLDEVFVRGTSPSHDDDTLYFNCSEDLDIFIRIVNEYNECYGSAPTGMPEIKKTCVDCKGAVVCEECMKNAKEVIDF